MEKQPSITRTVTIYYERFMSARKIFTKSARRPVFDHFFFSRKYLERRRKNCWQQGAVCQPTWWGRRNRDTPSKQVSANFHRRRALTDSGRSVSTRAATA